MPIPLIAAAARLIVPMIARGAAGAVARQGGGAIAQGIARQGVSAGAQHMLSAAQNRQQQNNR
jgi:hypothetical protein